MVLVNTYFNKEGHSVSGFTNTLCAQAESPDGCAPGALFWM